METKLITIPHIFKLLFLLGLAVVVHLAYLTSFVVVFGANYNRTIDNNYAAYIAIFPILMISTIVLADFLQMPNDWCYPWKFTGDQSHNMWHRVFPHHNFFQIMNQEYQ